MALAQTVQRCLEKHAVPFEIISHPPMPSASRIAQASHISGEKVAKGVLLRDADGYALAVVPASYHLQLNEIGRALGSFVGLASEEEVCHLFGDCAAGAIPAVGSAYGLDVLVDQSLVDLDEVYFEGGDHESLVRVRADDFKKLMAGALPGRFAEHDGAWPAKLADPA